MFVGRAVSVLVFPEIGDCNQAIDHLIESRRTIRRFTSEVPPMELIEKVIQAGLLAPYSGIGVSREDFRRFVVIPRESESLAQIATLLKCRAGTLYVQLEEQLNRNASLKSRGEAYLIRLKFISQQGVPNLGKAPYYIVVAEQRGIPSVEQLSLAHCLQNMWLKAVALGLGFQLLSITEQMANDKEFCGLIGIPVGEFALDGCLLGYPEVVPQPPKRPRIDEVTKWLS